MPKSKSKSDLHPDDILIAEFTYAAGTAGQANEDRAKVTSFYFVTVGTLLAAILGDQFLERSGAQLHGLFLGFSLVFVFLALLGYLTIAQLARLRLAWIESARAMNQIKDYYITRTGKELEKAFRWNTGTIPEAYKPTSIANLMAVEVSFLSGLVFGAAVYYGLQGAAYTSGLWAFTFVSGIMMAWLQFFLYRRMLSKGS